MAVRRVTLDCSEKAAGPPRFASTRSASSFDTIQGPVPLSKGEWVGERQSKIDPAELLLVIYTIGKDRLGWVAAARGKKQVQWQPCQKLGPTHIVSARLFCTVFSSELSDLPCLQLAAPLFLDQHPDPPPS